ncbi:hypothetical protein [Desulfohalovibrio reitneri]|uniref:hypothetical protein n=1 Tax=Desulfohalovibrio reitneri TaxID=1307759 RepID=UPI0013780AED|nr:hypothetical protein [Desulfohalovibrio reitneri]
MRPHPWCSGRREAGTGRAIPPRAWTQQAMARAASSSRAQSARKRASGSAGER